MKWTQAALLALVATAVFDTAAFSQPPGPPPPQDQRRGDDRRGDDRRGDDRYDRRGDDRRGGDRHGGRDPRRRWDSPRTEVGFFYDELSRYGEWVRTRDYGWAWYPLDVDPYWRPYLDGRWALTEYGWTWVSYEPFGWATYHYGRWAWDQRFGWLWVPGTVWGPAWVSWQQGGGYVGWAPLPPRVGFDLSFGIRLGGFDLSVGLDPESYVFVPERGFLDSQLDRFVVPSTRNAYIFRNTRNLTDYDAEGDRVLNFGLDRRRLELATGQPIRERRLGSARTRDRGEVSEREVRIYRPVQRELDSVRAGARVDQGLTAPPPPPPGWDDRDDRDGVQGYDFDVAPRVDRPQRYDARRVEADQRRQQQELERYHADERKRIEQSYREDLKKAGQAPQKQDVEQRHQAELQALQKQQAQAAEQLKAKQEAQREALQAPPADDLQSPPDP